MNTLIIFLKYPEPGKVKTRLAKDLGEARAAKVYSKMVETILRNVKSDTYSIAIYYDPPDQEEKIKNWIGKTGSRFHPQDQTALGNRISSAFENEFRAGSGKVVIIGSDCIGVNNETINTVFGLLDDNDVVIGPAEDGGYYLLGLNRHHPYIFENINWSTIHVLDQTLRKVRNNGLKSKLLNTLSDIDTIDDLNSSNLLKSEASEDNN